MPRSIGFKRMVDGCDVVAVARLSDGVPPERKAESVELEFTKVIKGGVKLGKHRVCFAQYPSVREGTQEFVAFLRKDLCWEFVAEPIEDGGAIAESILHVRGFNNWNAYFVGPGLVTLDQIEGFVRDRILVYNFRGKLYFPQRGHAEWKAGTSEIEVTYDAVKGRATVQGLPEIRGFPARPTVSVGGPGPSSSHREPTVTITYSDLTDPAFVIDGDIQALDLKTGTMRTKFFVANPDLLTQEGFEDYLSDPAKGNTYYTVNIKCAPFGNEQEPRVLKLTTGNAADGVGKLEGWSDNPLRLESMGASSEGGRHIATISAKLGVAEDLVLEFDLGPERNGADIFQWWGQEWLLYDLLVGDLPGKVKLQRGGNAVEITTCSASLGDVLYRQRERLRTDLDWPANDGFSEGWGDESDERYFIDCDYSCSLFQHRWWSLVAAAGLVLVLGAIVWRMRKARSRLSRRRGADG
jgi:hypothetical protein